MAHTAVSGTGNGRGMLVSALASVGFGVLYFIVPFADPMPSITLWGLRIVMALPVLFLALWTMRESRLIAEVWRIMRASPGKFLGMIVAGGLLSLQLWVFMWAPLAGRGLEVALGYFLLPLVLVLMGRIVYRDQLRWWHWLAVACAAVGVVCEIITVGRISWETLLVALGYPPYFALRRAMGTESLGGMFWEQLVALPVAVVAIVWTAGSTPVLTERPSLWIIGVLITGWGGVSMVLYILASKMLPISVFGLLTYLEPALLTLASLLIGESIAASEIPAYIAVWAAVVIVLAGGIGQVLRSRRGRSTRAPEPDELFPAAPATGSIPIQAPATDGAHTAPAAAETAEVPRPAEITDPAEAPETPR